MYHKYRALIVQRPPVQKETLGQDTCEIVYPV